MFKRKNGKRLTKAVILTCLLALLTSTVALASGTNIPWLQTTTPTLIKDLGELTPGNQQQVYISGSMYAPTTGEYKVKLQKRGFMWTWSDVSNVYTGTQKIGTAAQGQPFTWYWHTTTKDVYRVVFYDATQPQAATIYNFEYGAK